jgi:hypothetical protein
VRLFVRFDRHGVLSSASKVEVMSDGMAHPFGALEEGERVLEIQPTAEQAKLLAHDLVEHYSVDVKKRKLQKRARRARPSR